MQPKRLSEPRACADEYGGSGSYCLVLLDGLAESPSASPPRKEGSYPKTSTANVDNGCPSNDKGHPENPPRKPLYLSGNTRLARGNIEIYSRWEHMLALAQSDPDGAFSIAKAVLRARLRAGVPYVVADEVRPFLTHVLAKGTPETQDRARDLINDLGEHGFRELKDLLQD